MRWRGTATTGLSAMRRRAKAAACARGLNSLVNGTGANTKMGEMLIIIYLAVTHNSPIVYQIVKYYVYVT